MFETFKSRVYLVLGIELLVILVGGFLIGLPSVAIGLGALLINAVCIEHVFRVQEQDNKKRIYSITRILGNDAKDAFNFGEVGIVTYDDKGHVTWMSDLFYERKVVDVNKNLGHQLSSLIPLLQGEVDTLEIQIKDRYYRVIRKENAEILFFKDITELKQLQQQMEADSLVLGFINVDNLEEAIQYVDEHKATQITGTIRQSIMEWAKEYKMILRRYRNDRYMMVMNEANYVNVVNDRFKILDTIRHDAAKLDVAITLSMSFARGTSDIMALDEMAFEALELAQSRGGDQVVYKKYGSDPVFFGGTTEAFEKRSRVRVRVIAQTLRDLINESSNVIIVGHQNADFDCVGSALCVSAIVRSYHKECAIVLRSGGVEEKLSLALEKYDKELSERHMFVSEEEALESLGENTLVIAVDHHILSQSNGKDIVSNAKKVVIIDHHRRGMDLIPNSILLYIESSASSTSELALELVYYQQTYIDISEIEATIMLTGVLIDTNRFRNHTGTRTFEVAANLKKMGADLQEADEMLKDNYDEFLMKQMAMRNLQMLGQGVVISAMDEMHKTPSRAILSQVADHILSVKDVEAAFVIGQTADGKTCISARSKGNVNCQVLMEVFQGGGHFSAAAAQIPNQTVKEVNDRLIEAIHKYFSEEGINNESDFTK